jgi:hypothetical protein
LAEAIAAQAKAEAVHVPVPPQLLADDSTPEALANLLAAHRRIAVLSAEGGVFDMMAGRYQSSVGPNLDVYLKGHAGDPIRVDRVTAKRVAYVAAAALTIGVTVQPAVLRACRDRPGFRGRGLLARFAYAVPQSTVGYRKVGAPPVPRGCRPLPPGVASPSPVAAGRGRGGEDGRRRGAGCAPARL